MTVHGNLTGLKPGQKKALDRFYERQVPHEKIISPSFAQLMVSLSKEIKRQVGVFIDRGGQITHVFAGTQSTIWLPDFGRLRAGLKRFRGLRYVHTHLNSEPLSRDDLTDMVRLRLDMAVALGVTAGGTVGMVYLAHLMPPSENGQLYNVSSPFNIGMLPGDFPGFIKDLEDEFARKQTIKKVDAPYGRAIAVHVNNNQETKSQTKSSLLEIVNLAKTAGVHVADKIIQTRKKQDPLYVMGLGKLQDVTIKAMQLDAEMLIMDCDLGPNQAMAISSKTNLKVIDRSQLILDIFAARANSVDGKIKVELAQLKYLMPRIRLKDDSLSRLTGGIGGRGPGETKLEIGRRRSQDRITRLSKKMKKLAKARKVRRKKRKRNNIPVISIVGYTNAGKSTLLNSLTDSKVKVEDRLFATLDTASRLLRFPQNRQVIFTDTVGFIKNLPKDLLEAFKATLEEMEDAFLILHVVDISDPSHEEHINCVRQILEQLNLGKIPEMLVFNKADLVNDDEMRSICFQHDAIKICARDKETLIPLLKDISRHIWQVA